MTDVEMPVWQWAVNLGLAGMVGLVGFLLRKTLADVTEQLSGLSHKVEELRGSHGDHSTSVRLLESQAADLRAEVQRLRERAHELLQEVTLLKALVYELRSPRTPSGNYPAAGGGGYP